jgi:hypothetical protein
MNIISQGLWNCHRNYRGITTAGEVLRIKITWFKQDYHCWSEWKNGGWMVGYVYTEPTWWLVQRFSRWRKILTWGAFQSYNLVIHNFEDNARDGHGNDYNLFAIRDISPWYMIMSRDLVLAVKMKVSITRWRLPHSLNWKIS